MKMEFPWRFLLLQLFSSVFIAQLSQCDQFPIHLTPDQPLSDPEESQLLYLHKRLIEIESITGNEKSVGDWLADYLTDHGLKVEKQKVAPHRFNILAYPGDNPHTKVLLTSHIDTVPPFIPYSVKNDSIWGRGSVDAKACVAAQTLAALRIISNYNSKSLSAPSVSLLFVVGEEKNGDGMRYFSAHPPTNYSAVIFGEPTEGKLASGHKGLILFKVQITGRASHSGYPWLGLSANALMIEALSALINLEERLPSSEKLGRSTLNVGIMKGGLAANVVAEKAEAEVAVRIRGGTPDKIQKLIDGALEDTRRKAVAKGGAVDVVYNNTQYGPVIIDTDIPGFETIGVNYGTDIPNFKGNHKTYLYGPGSILVAHGADEHLKIGELKDAVQMYEKMVMYLLEN